jgi:inner membrane protein
MEPVTHLLTGACIARAGLNRKTGYAVLAAVLAAEAADIDVVWMLRGPVEELNRHRGITHTLVAAPVLAGAVVGAVWLLRRWREGRRLHSRTSAGWPNSIPLGEEVRPVPPLPQKQERGKDGASRVRGASGKIRWGWLYLTALIAALSHLLLDWTNNYGLRPFYPFDAHWYAGSFVFIAEPVVWALLLAALIVPWLLGLADSEIGARRKPFRGQGWAIFALSGMVLLGCWRWAERAQALAMVQNTQVASAPATRVAMEPYPVDLFRWHAILETPDYYQTAEIDTRSGEIKSDPRRDVLFKPSSTPAVEAARRTPLGRVYLDWGAWAVVRDLGQVPVPGLAPPQLPPNRSWTTVEFTDLRFTYSYLGQGRSDGPSPLSGWVYIVDGRDEAGESLGGRVQR